MALDSSVKIKIGIIGPCESGKTTLANFLADATESIIEEYYPTHVVRILEFDTVKAYKKFNINTSFQFAPSSFENICFFE